MVTCFSPLAYLWNAPPKLHSMRLSRDVISIFGAPALLIIDRESNLDEAYMHDQLGYWQSQLCPILTDEPWYLWIKWGIHDCVHNSSRRLISEQKYNTRINAEILAGYKKIRWSLCHLHHSKIPNFYRFGSIPCIIRQQETSLKINEMIALMQLCTKSPNDLRGTKLLSRVLHTNHHSIRTSRNLTVNKRACFTAVCTVGVRGSFDASIAGI